MHTFCGTIYSDIAGEEAVEDPIIYLCYYLKLKLLLLIIIIINIYNIFSLLNLLSIHTTFPQK
jgi:hypothetical protein